MCNNRKTKSDSEGIFFYRTISHASPDNISIERNFTTKSQSASSVSPSQNSATPNKYIQSKEAGVSEGTLSPNNIHQSPQISVVSLLQENTKTKEETSAAVPSNLQEETSEPDKLNLTENVNSSNPFGAFAATSLLKKNAWILFIIIFLAALVFLWRTKK